MARTQYRSKRKVTGGLYKNYRKKRKFELVSNATLTKVGKLKIKKERIIGGNIKFRLLVADIVNVYNPNTKKYEKANIKTVIDNPANQHYVRRNIITKGAIVDTDKGKVRITSRPGQEGSLNGVLIWLVLDKKWKFLKYIYNQN